ncbi:RsmB/NOP family class I SAM-dependent RNA methyltransferase [Sulfitobacter sp. LCG007]
MTPGARVQAAIEVLDTISGGVAAEQALTQWARRSRFAGSKDRAAVRDHVFDVLRRKRAAAALGGGETGRALMLGLLRIEGVPPESLFTGEGHAPAPLGPDETNPKARGLGKAEAWNLPDWILPEFTLSLGAQAGEIAGLLQKRAPVSLRVNLRKTDLAGAGAALAAEGIEVRPNPRAATALTVTEGAGRLRNARAYRDGWVELQDASSQAAIAGLPPGGRVLDYCAGGGGKALALAMDPDRRIDAHDADPRRMRDLPARAARAGVEIRQVSGKQAAQSAPYDLVLCDAPCSGSGAWRRAPEGKWSLDAARLSALNVVQDSILDTASRIVAARGLLVYVTCSVLECENSARIDRFLADHPDWRCVSTQRFLPDADGDGFFAAHLTRDHGNVYST